MNRPQQKPRVLSARWVLTAAGDPIEHGEVLVEAGQIVAVAGRGKLSADSRYPVQAFDDAVLIPGLVNAHTHLEFSLLNEPLGHQGISMTDWIPKVIECRNGISETVKQSAIAAGLRQARETGTVAIGEIATAPTHRAGDYGESPEIFKTIFLEQLTRDPSLLPARAAEAQAHVDQADRGSSEFQFALSPHAPYSVHSELLNQMVELALSTKSKLAMHVAESAAEIELLETKTGAFVDLFQSMGIWNPDSFGETDSIDAILKQLSRIEGALLIHGNFLSQQQFEFAAQQGISIVCCPRTHAWFAHEAFPVSEMIAAGVNVAVGTDSRASNPDLNLLEELKNLHQRTSLPAATILEMGTANGAKALGIDREYGTIEPGKSAALAVIEIAQPNDPYSFLAEREAVARAIIDPSDQQ